MIAELAALASLYKPHMTCVLHAPKQADSAFYSDTAPTQDGLLVVQHNYFKGFSEIIAIAFDVKARRYVRTQLTNDGSIGTATATAPINGVWTWKKVQIPNTGSPELIHFGIVNGKLRYWYAGGVYSICT